MGTRAWVCRDPARREEFLQLLRDKPRSTIHALAAKMDLSLSTIRNLVLVFERTGAVASEIDSTARRIPKSGAPKVVWLVPKRKQRIGKRPLPRVSGFAQSGSQLRGWPYAPTGTPPALSGGVQILTIEGRRA
jgi:predicted ArsR family transcriptional regulator